MYFEKHQTLSDSVLKGRFDFKKDQTDYIEIQPGLSVCISCFDTSSGPCSFSGDSQYIHLNCILKGRFEARIKNMEICLTEGETNIGFSDGETFYMPGSTQFYNLAVMVTPELLHELAGDELIQDSFDKDISFFVRNVGKNSKAASIALQIAVFMNQYPQKKILLHAAVLNFIHWTLSAHHSSDCECYITGPEKQKLEAAKDYLLKDLSQAPTISNISEFIGLNQCKLKKGFKTLYGKSIYSFFQEMRMKEAFDLLRENNVTETAMILGYSNMSHFSSAFKRQFGMNPKDARKELGDKLST